MDTKALWLALFGAGLEIALGASVVLGVLGIMALLER